MSCHSICSSREVLWEALPRDSGLRSVASEPALKVPSSHVKPLRLQPVSLTLPASPSPSPAPISELWHGLRALQAQHQQQVDFMEKLQREAQEGHLKLLQVSTRVDQLEMNAQSFPGFIQRELETRLLQEREMQRVVQTQGANWSLQAAQQGLAALESTVHALAARFEARVQTVELGSDVKVAEGILQAEPLAAEQLAAAMESRLTEIHLTLREHSNALERVAAAQHSLEDAMAGLRLSCEFSALEDGPPGLERRMQMLERNFQEVGSSQKLHLLEGQLKGLQVKAAEESKRFDNVLLELQGLRQGATQLQEEVARQGRLAQDLHVAQLHNDTAAELENQRLIERLERLEDGTRNGKTEDLADQIEVPELKALWRSISGLAGRVELVEGKASCEQRPLTSSPRAAALSAVEKMEAATQRLMAYKA